MLFFSLLYSSPEEVEDISSKMLGNKLHTIQTGDVGRPCNEVLLSLFLFGLAIWVSLGYKVIYCNRVVSSENNYA